MKVLHCLLLTAGVGFFAPYTLAEVDSSQAKSEAAAAKEARAAERAKERNRRVCRRVQLTSTRITRRICRRQYEWDEIERTSQELAERMSGAGLPTGAGGGP